MESSTPVDLQRQNDQLKRLVDLSVTLNSMLDLDDMLGVIVNTATALLDCEAASVMLYDEKHPHLYFAAAAGSDAVRLSDVPVPIEGSLAGTIFRTNRPMIVNDVQHEPRHYTRVAKTLDIDVRTLLGVPMMIKDRTVGVLEAVNKRTGPFTEEDEGLLSVAAAHAAIAIQNARLLSAAQDALEKLKEASQLKSNFLAVASHELRTPLGIIIGYASFLKEDSTAQVSADAQHVLGAALQMRSLVEDMTNLTMLESDDQMLLKPQPVAIQSILRSACSEVTQIASAKDQSLVFAFHEQPIMVHVDPSKMVTAFVNLLNNAVRYSPNSSDITVGAVPEEDQILVWIRDHGIGIQPDQLQKIFQPFYQAETPNTRRYGGLGIGLAIAKGLIEAQGGKIWAESEGEGQGSTFKVLLPRPS